MEIVTVVSEYLAGLGLDVAREHYKETLDEKKLKLALQKYIAEQEKYNEVCSVAEECDFHQLVEYISNSMIEDVERSFFSANTEERRKAKEMIVSKAVNYSNAVDDVAKVRVEWLIAESLEIIKNFYRNKTPYQQYLLGADIVDAVKENFDMSLDKLKTDLVDELKVSIGSERSHSSDNMVGLTQSSRCLQNEKQPNQNKTEKVVSENVVQSLLQRKNRVHKQTSEAVAKYLGIVGALIVVVGVWYFASVGQRDKMIEPIEEIETEGTVDFLGLDVTPLSMFDRDLYGENISQNRHIEKKYAKEGFDKGCVWKTTVINRKKNPVEISDVMLVIDEIKKIEQARPIVLGCMNNNKLQIYLINDGTRDFNGKVQLSFRYYDEQAGKDGYLEDYIVERVLSPRVFGKYEDIQGGEISRIAQYDVSCKELQNWMEEHYENSGIYIMAKVVDGYSGMEYEYDLGCMYAASSSRVCLEHEWGEEYEIPVDNPIVLDPDIEYQSGYESDTVYKIGSNEVQNIQIAMLATESCEVSFHIEIGTKEGEKIITDEFEEKIVVPFYKNGKQNRYSEVMKYLVWHDISVYRYNQDAVIQENIAYKLEDMITKDEFISSEDTDLEPDTENISEENGGVISLQNYDCYGLYGEVLRQYYEAAASKFLWETIQTKCYVNEGASNYYNNESYALYFMEIDLADDGSPELVIAIDKEDDPMNIVDIFTIENDKVTRIIDNDGSVAYRNRYYICKNKTIKNIGSGGAINSQTEYFKLLPNSSELVLVDSYVYNGWNGEWYSHTNRMGEENTLSFENMDEVNGIDDMDYQGEWNLLYQC